MKTSYRDVLMAMAAGYAVMFSAAVWADIYKYEGSGGAVTYSNVPFKGSKRISLDALNTQNHPAKGGGTASRNPLPREYASVDADTQRRRDGTRRKILEDELASEMKQLDEAQKAFTAQKKGRFADRDNQQSLESYRDSVTRHEKNVAALRKEISGMK